MIYKTSYGYYSYTINGMEILATTKIGLLDTILAYMAITK